MLHKLHFESCFHRNHTLLEEKKISKQLLQVATRREGFMKVTIWRPMENFRGIMPKLGFEGQMEIPPKLNSRNILRDYSFVSSWIHKWFKHGCQINKALLGWGGLGNCWRENWTDGWGRDQEELTCNAEKHFALYRIGGLCWNSIQGTVWSDFILKIKLHGG